jgi:hypothetical protein
MPYFKVLIVGLLLAPLTLHAAEVSEANVRLAYKFRRGEVLRYSVKHSADIESTIAGTTQQAETISQSIKAWKVTDVLPSGEMEFVHVVEAVRMTNRVPNRAAAEYDSERDKTPPPGFEQTARAVGVPLSVIRIKPTGEIVSRVVKHPQPDVSDDMPITLRLPEGPVAIGDEWNESFDVVVDQESGGQQKVRTRRLCQLKSVQNGIATFAIDYQVLTPVSPFVESQLVERMSKGTVRFDIAKGRIASQQQDVDRRILGFSGETSRMHFVSRLEERLLKPNERLAQKP